MFNVNFLIVVDKKQVADIQYYVIPPRGGHGQGSLWWQCAFNCNLLYIVLYSMYNKNHLNIVAFTHNTLLFIYSLLLFIYCLLQWR